MSKYIPGTIWRGNYIDSLHIKEAEMWDKQPLPFGWSILSKPIVMNSSEDKTGIEVEKWDGFASVLKQVGQELRTNISFQICLWVNLSIGTRTSDCGDYYYFEDGGPFDNGFIYCPFCGKVLMVPK